LPAWANGFEKLCSDSFQSQLVTQGRAQSDDFARMLDKGMQRVAELRQRSPLRQLGLRTIIGNIPDSHAECTNIGKSGLKREDLAACLKSLVSDTRYSLGIMDDLCIEQICSYIALTEAEQIDIFEALSLLPLFCGGEEEDNERVLFDFIGASKDTSLTMYQFQRFLNPCVSWCLEVCGLEPHLAESLTAQLAQQIFVEVNVGSSGRISLAKWLGWRQSHSFYQLLVDRLSPPQPRLLSHGLRASAGNGAGAAVG